MEHRYSPEKYLPENDSSEKREKIEGVPEKERAEIIALGKLNRLMAEDFRDFAVRFVNSDEYRDIVERNLIRSREVYIPSAACRDPNKSPIFIEYLRNSKLDWTRTVRSQTNWEFSTKGIEEHKELIQFFKKAHQEARSRQNLKNVRTNTMKTFHDILLNPESEFNKRIRKKSEILKGGYYSNVESIVNIAKRYSESKKQIGELKNKLGSLIGNRSGELMNLIRQSAERNRSNEEIWNDVLYQKKSGRLIWPQNEEENIKEVVKSLSIQQRVYLLNGGEDKVAIVNEFIENPDNFLSSEKLHRLFQALTWGPKRTGSSQYQIALIFDMSAVNKAYGSFWEPLKGYSIDNKEKPDYDPKQSLLSAISVIANRKFTEELVNLSVNSGEWSHPVFDSSGVLRYPKKEFAAKE